MVTRGYQIFFVIFIKHSYYFSGSWAQVLIVINFKLHLILIVLRVVQSILMNQWTIRIVQIFGKNKYTVFPSLVIVLPVQWGIP